VGPLRGRGTPLYWLFVFAVAEVMLFLDVAIKRGDQDMARSVVVATMAVALVWFVTMMVRLVRHQRPPDDTTGHV
jgi:hypothetical protein